MKFKIGDVVIANKDCWEIEARGMTGKVIGFSASGGNALVEFSRKIKNGHDGNPRSVELMQGTYGKYGHCWYFDEDQIEKEEVLSLIENTLGEENVY